MPNIPPPPPLSSIPPPPPMSKALESKPKLNKNAAKDRSAMLNDITKFKAGKLKKTVTNDRSGPVLDSECSITYEY